MQLVGAYVFPSSEVKLIKYQFNFMLVAGCGRRNGKFNAVSIEVSIPEDAFTELEKSAFPRLVTRREKRPRKIRPFSLD